MPAERMSRRDASDGCLFVRRWIVDAPSGLDLQRTVEQELWETGDETWYYYNCAPPFSLWCCAESC